MNGASAKWVLYNSVKTVDKYTADGTERGPYS